MIRPKVYVPLVPSNPYYFQCPNPYSLTYNVRQSMDEIGDFNPTDTGGFIKVQAIRLKKFGLKKQEMGEDLVTRKMGGS